MYAITQFPSPREMNKFISHVLKKGIKYTAIVSVPSRGRQVYIRTSPSTSEAPTPSTVPFPSPREVNRFISGTTLHHILECIGFPSPLEVNRFISQVFQKPIILTLKFPSPREVYRFISQKLLKRACLSNTFPSPLEADRFISKPKLLEREQFSNGFRPLSRNIGLYLTIPLEACILPVMFPSPLEVNRFISMTLKMRSWD